MDLIANTDLSLIDKLSIQVLPTVFRDGDRVTYAGNTKMTAMGNDLFFLAGKSGTIAFNTGSSKTQSGFKYNEEVFKVVFDSVTEAGAFGTGGFYLFIDQIKHLI